MTPHPGALQHAGAGGILIGMTDTPFILEDFLPYQLAVVAEQVSREFAATYREKFGLGRAEWRVVAHLSQSEAVSVREIHIRANLDKSRVSRAAARLVDEGYVAKVQNVTDKRLVELTLTDKGRAMVAELTPLAHAYQNALLERLGPEAAATLTGLGNLAPRD